MATHDLLQDRLELVDALHAHRGWMLAYAFAITADRHLADDVYQEVAVVLAERWHEVPAGDGRLPWLRQVVRRKALELRRKARRHPLLSAACAAALAEAFAPEPEPEAQLRGAVARCLARLPPDAREAVERRYRGEQDCQAIAVAIGRSVKAVYALLKRARLLLGRCLERATESG